jgi:RNA polymerase sigma-54 factor
MNIRPNISTGTKTKLSQTLKNWFPILMANIEDLEDVIKEYKNDNPIIDLASKKEENFSQYQSTTKEYISNDRAHKSNENLEKFSISHKSIYEALDDQICFPVFPTPKSQEIATKIVQNITDEGYFDGDVKKIAKELKVKPSEVEKIRLRFGHCEPVGICAKDLAESLKFQLNSSEASGDTYNTALVLIDNFENIYDFCDLPEYKSAVKTIRGFNNPPAIEFLKDSQVIVPDIIVSFSDEKIVVNINNDYYPDILIDTEGLPEEDSFIKRKVKMLEIL